MRLRDLPSPAGPLLLLGALGALAFAVENAHQSWSALYLGDELGAGPATAAAGPAVFAAVVAVTRLAAARAGSRRPTAVVVAGSVLAAAGTAILAVASTVPFGLLGLGPADAGCYAMALALALTRNGTPAERIEVLGTCELDRRGGEHEYEITGVRLDVRAVVAGLDDDALQAIARRADAECPISNALRGSIPVELACRLEAAAA